MKTINVAELKAHLSEYLRRAQNGERIVVLDGKTPIAELVPLRHTGNVWERLGAEKGVRLGNGSRAPFTPSKTHKKLDWERHDTAQAAAAVTIGLDVRGVENEGQVSAPRRRPSIPP